jgi:DNA polymerase-1
MAPSSQTFLILDTFNFLHRAYHAIPTNFHDKDGNPTNAVYGVSSMLISVLTEYQPTYVAAAFESKEKETFRAAEFVGYKAHRPEMENDLRVQIPIVEKVFAAIGVKRVALEGFEADDVIGCLTKITPTSPTNPNPPTFSATEKGSEAKPSVTTLIVSNDQDILQLVNERVKVVSPAFGQKKAEIFDTAAVIAKYGFKPSQMIDYKALRGDPSDNIPGVFGIGEKTAKDLVAQFGSVDNLYQHLEQVEKAAVRQKLAEGAELAAQSKRLATIRCDLPLPIKLEDLTLLPTWKAGASGVFQELHFKSLVSRLENKPTASISHTSSTKNPQGQLNLL